jgi:hypothetical protein
MLKEVEESEQTVVYNLDDLIVEDRMLGRLACDNSSLCNNDESYIKAMEAKKQITNPILITTNNERSSLNFESRFESGNLRKAINIGDRQYNLIICPDVNAAKHHQWFYFQVSNMSGEARIDLVCTFAKIILK